MKLKKLTAVFTILACAGVLASSFGMTATAATYHSGDINHDGCVDIIDAMIFRDYLEGKTYVASTRMMDVDRNNIVDYADYQCIMATIIKANYKNVVDGLNHEFKATTVSFNKPTEAKTIQENYVKYVYESARNNLNYKPKEYTLSLKENLSYIYAPSFNDSISKKAIIGSDDRQSSIQEGLVVFRNPYNGESWGTGFIVDSHTVATAAHCVYSHKENPTDPESHWVDDFSMYSFENNRKLTPISAQMPKGYLEEDGVQYDYALITVKEDLSSYHHFKLGVPYGMYSSNYLKKYSLYVTGFPDEHNNELYSAKGNLFIINPNLTSSQYKSYFCYDTDTTAGESGAPVYVNETYAINDKEYNIDVATCVHTWNYDNLKNGGEKFNMGVPFNSIMLKFYLNNSCIKEDYQ